MLSQEAKERRQFNIEGFFSKNRKAFIRKLIHRAAKEPSEVELVVNRLDYLIDMTDKIDSYTKLANKIGLKHALELAIKVAHESATPLSLLYIDGDKFKKINDELSHQIGDQIILAMAEGIRRAVLRSYDTLVHIASENRKTLARQGGDEFAVILPGASLEGAKQVALRIQSEISKLVDRQVPEYQRHFSHPFTVTVGVAGYDPDQDINWQALLLKAEVNMQKLKSEKGVARA